LRSPNNNGKVGIWGISYPGFYASMAGIDAHPAIKAISPQAPIANWFGNDDWHHNGAFALSGSLPFMAAFGIKREGLVQEWPPLFEFRSEERRVGKECRTRWSQYLYNNRDRSSETQE